MRRHAPLLSLVLLAVTAPVAHADVKVEVQDAPRKIRFVDNDGVANQLSIRQDGASVSFTDPATALTAGSGCTASGNVVTCTPTGSGFRVQADLGGGDDQVTATTTMSV